MGTWVLAFEYDDPDAAFIVWNKAQESIRGFVGTGHTSAYRSLVQGRMTVIIIGETGFSGEDMIKEVFRDICVEGKETEVPQEVIDLLLEKRKHFRQTGLDFRTRHFRPPGY